MTTTHVVLIVLGVLALKYAFYGVPRRKRASPVTSQDGMHHPEQQGEPNS